MKVSNTCTVRCGGCDNPSCSLFGGHNGKEVGGALCCSQLWTMF